MIEINEIYFSNFLNQIGKKEGIVLLGADGDLQEWIDEVKEIWIEEEIAKENPFLESYLLTTLKGRKDLVLIVDFSKVDMSKLSIWRIKFGDCSWISDYIDNYAKEF